MTVLLSQVPKIPAPMGWTPDEALNKRVHTFPSRWILVSQNNQAHVPDSDYIHAGLKGIDANPGFGRESPAYQRGDCMSGGPFAGEDAIETKTLAQVDALAVKAVNSVKHKDGTDPGVAFLTGQVNEQGYTTHTGSKSTRLSWKIGQLQDARISNGVQFVWTGLDYDGFVLYELLQDGINNALQLANLANKDTILTYLREKAAPFGNNAFRVHTVPGAGDNGSDLVVQGAAVYLTPQFRAYTTGLEAPGYFAAFCACCVMLGRVGLEALASLTRQDGSFYHTSAQQARLRSRQVCGFIANIKTQGGDESFRNEIVRYELPNGNYLQGVTFATNVYQQMLGGNIAMLCEEKGEFIFDFNPTAKIGHLPTITIQHGTESGYPIGEFAPDGQPASTLPTATPVYEYVDASVPVPFPITPQGIQDVLFDAGNQVLTLRTWIGNMDPLPFASLKVIGRSDSVADETSFCSTYTRESYVFRRYKLDNAPWGYIGYDPLTGNVGLVAQTYSIPPDVTFILQATINGTTIETPRIFGNHCRIFLGRIPINV